MAFIPDVAEFLTFARGRPALKILENFHRKNQRQNSIFRDRVLRQTRHVYFAAKTFALSAAQNARTANGEVSTMPVAAASGLAWP